MRHTVHLGWLQCEGALNVHGFPWNWLCGTQALRSSLSQGPGRHLWPECRLHSDSALLGWPRSNAMVYRSVTVCLGRRWGESCFLFFRTTRSLVLCVHQICRPLVTPPRRSCCVVLTVRINIIHTGITTSVSVRSSNLEAPHLSLLWSF